ncbi:MAG: hypothetical protein JRC92_10470, partial [Deltaproteobacteria bacterium]|nr:hypothetical protein [Deltaproteobacteria bacterium]
MERNYFVTGQPVTNDDFKSIYEAGEVVDANHVALLHGAGILTGLGVSENDPTPDMNVRVASGHAADGYGTWINQASLTTEDCSQDRDGNPTVPSTGKERYITLVAVHDWDKSGLKDDPVGWPDEDGKVYTVWADGADVEVIAGAEANPGTAVKPTPAADEVVLADVLLTDSTTQITDAMIDTDRRATLKTIDDLLAEIGAVTASFSSEQAGRPYFNAVDKLDFATGRVPLILADEELVL